MHVDAPAWFEDDAFWSTLAPAIFSPDRVHAAPAEVEAVLRLVGARPPARVLDLCAGTGRHAIELAARGFDVTAVDRTRPLLDRAALDAASRGVAIDCVLEDMRRFLLPGAFDLALNLYTSFGYFDDAADDLAVARNVRRSLARGGAAVFEMVGKELIGQHFVDHARRTVGELHLVEERRVGPDWATLEWRWSVERDGVRREYAVRHRLYSGVELATLLAAAGFTDVRLFGGFEGGPYDRSARCLVAVARA